MKMPEPPTKSMAQVDNDVYPALITLCRPVMDPANPSLCLLNDNHKSMVDLRFQLDELDDEGNPIVLYRNKMSVSYGQYAGKWADWSMLIEATLGIPGGDKAQHNVDTDELLNKRCRVQTAKVPSKKNDGQVYTNVVGYFAPKKARPTSEPAPAAEPAPAPKTTAQRVGLEDADLADLPF